MKKEKEKKSRLGAIFSRKEENVIQMTILGYTLRRKKMARGVSKSDGVLCQKSVVKAPDQAPRMANLGVKGREDETMGTGGKTAG